MSETATASAPPRKRGSGVGRVYETLRKEIIDLELPPGSPIDEVQLSQRFGMSRTPVREALVRLASDNLVVALPNRSTIVAPIDFLNLGAFFNALTLMYRMTTRQAARHADENDLAEIRRLQEAFATAVSRQDALAMIDTNRDFHVAIAQAGRNPYYADFFTRLLDEGRRLLRLYYSSFNDELPTRYVDEHEEMVDAIVKRDMERADAIATGHAEQIVRQIRDYITSGSIDLPDLAGS